MTRRSILVGGSFMGVAFSTGRTLAYESETKVDDMSGLNETHDFGQGVLLPERRIPNSKLASPEARAFQQGLVGPDGRPIPRAQAFPDVSDHEAWTQLKKVTNAAMNASLEPVAARQTASCETIQMSGVTVQLATPASGSRNEDYVLLDMHGGALIYCEGEFCRVGARRQAESFGVQVYAVDYRNPPEHPYPAALDDCVAVYRELLKRYAPENIIIGGLSAGGNLAAATILRARDEGLPLPAAALLLTPEVDLTESGDSFTLVDGLDISYPVSLMPINLLYANGHDLRHPYLSPLFGDFTKGFPPTFLQAGTRDFFLSNAASLHRKLRRAGIPAELHVFEGMPHGGFGGSAPEDGELANEVRRFVNDHWGRKSA